MASSIVSLFSIDPIISFVDFAYAVFCLTSGVS